MNCFKITTVSNEDIYLEDLTGIDDEQDEVLNDISAHLVMTMCVIIVINKDKNCWQQEFLSKRTKQDISFFDMIDATIIDIDAQKINLD